MTKDERIDQLSSEVMELREQLRLAQVRAADAADEAERQKKRADRWKIRWEDEVAANNNR